MAEAQQIVLQFRCDCSRSWHEVWPVPLRTDAMQGRLKAITCPSCNNREVHLFLETEEGSLADLEGAT